jgi:hypothetical protein
VREPFARGWISRTFSLRLDWSPDGGHLAAVNSFQSPCHTVALLDRADWSFDFSMVGHRGAPEAPCALFLLLCLALAQHRAAD